MAQPTSGRSLQQIREHYLVEKELAAKLRAANREERRRLYTSLYDEMFRRVPHHPMLHRKHTRQESDQRVERALQFLSPFLRPSTTYLEVGPGDCALAIAVAARVSKVYAVDVSTELSCSPSFPPNFELVISDGTSIPAPAGSVDVAFSNQLMEHLHPDDAREQLCNIHTALAPGGVYVCLTPNRLSGPHDVSRHFDDVASCFHLKEYTICELHDLFADVGFSRMKGVMWADGGYHVVPLSPVTLLERALARSPRRWIRRTRLRKLLAQGVVATK